MAESKVNRQNYITIQGWMLTDLKLKGNELIIYSCIYGFSQAENQVFSGSLQYLSDWTNSTKQGVMKCLKSLVEKGYIAKDDKYINGVKFCEYRATEFNTVINKVEQGMQQSLTPPMQQSLTNNLSFNNQEETLKNIIDYLNLRAGTMYKPSTDKTKTLVRARMQEGFTLENFKTVIDKKCNEWLGDEKWGKYLRPETLFGTKFESYLNAPAIKPTKYGANGVAMDSREEDELDGIL